MRSVKLSVLVAAALFLVLCIFATPKRYYCSGTVAGTTVRFTPLWQNPGEPGLLQVRLTLTPRPRYEFLGIDGSGLLFELLVSLAVGAAIWAAYREESEMPETVPVVPDAPARAPLTDVIGSVGAAMQRTVLGIRWRMAARRQERMARRQAAAPDNRPADEPRDAEPEPDPDAGRVVLSAAQLLEEDTYEQFTRRMERLLREDEADEAVESVELEAKPDR